MIIFSDNPDLSSWWTNFHTDQPVPKEIPVSVPGTSSQQVPIDIYQDLKIEPMLTEASEAHYTVQLYEVEKFEILPQEDPFATSVSYGYSFKSLEITVIPEHSLFLLPTVQYVDKLRKPRGPNSFPEEMSQSLKRKMSLLYNFLPFN